MSSILDRAVVETTLSALDNDTKVLQELCLEYGLDKRPTHALACHEQHLMLATDTMVRASNHLHIALKHWPKGVDDAQD